jgi:hypothetical protein
METKSTDLVGFADLPRHEQSLDMLIGAVNGTRQGDPRGLEHSLSTRLDVYNYPRVKTLSILSNSSMNLIINNMLEVGYATMLERMSAEDREYIETAVLATSHTWITKEMEKK